MTLNDSPSSSQNLQKLYTLNQSIVKEDRLTDKDLESQSIKSIVSGHIQSLVKV